MSANDTSSASDHDDDSSADSSLEENTEESGRNEPHTFVHYRHESLGKDLEIVHHSRIKDFDYDMIKSFNKFKMYKIFWSSIPGDSPSLMLKRIEGGIPVFNRNLACYQPGYYRASISAIAGTYAALKKAIKGKRVVSVPKESLTVAFDDSSQSKNTGKKRPSRHSSKVQTDSTKPQNVKSKNRFTANKANLRDALLKDAPELQAIAENVVEERSNKKPQAKRGNDSNSSDSSLNRSDDELVSPSKVRKLEGEVKLQRATITKINSLNMRLQEKLQSAEEEADKLRSELSALRSKEALVCKSLFGPKPTRSHQTSGAAPRTIPSSCKTPLLKTSHMTVVDHTSPALSSSSSTQINESSNDDFSVTHLCSTELEMSPVSNMENSDSLSGIEPIQDLPMETSERIESCSDAEPKERSESTESPSDGIKEPVKQTSKAIVGTSGDGDTETYQFEDGKIMPSHILLMFKGIPNRAKSDLRFIKNAAVYIFGPEVLASSTVDGTKKGQKKGDLTPTSQKPGLDKDLFASLVKFFEWRLERSGVLRGSDEFKTRAELVRIKQSIRDKQKKLRRFGFGVGAKGVVSEDKLISTFETS